MTLPEVSYAVYAAIAEGGVETWQFRAEVYSAVGRSALFVTIEEAVMEAIDASLDD